MNEGIKIVLALLFVLLAIPFVCADTSQVVSEGGVLYTTGGGETTLVIDTPRYSWNGTAWINFTDYVSASVDNSNVTQNVITYSYGGKNVVISAIVAPDNCTYCTMGGNEINGSIDETNSTQKLTTIITGTTSANTSLVYDLSNITNLSYIGSCQYVLDAFTLDFNDLLYGYANVVSLVCNETMVRAYLGSWGDDAIFDPNLTISSSGTYCGNYSYDNIIINNSATVTICAYNGTGDSGTLFFNVSGNFTLASGATITGTSNGRTGGAGGNKGTYVPNVCNGGSPGNGGTAGGGNGGAGGTMVDCVTNSCGSGGGGGGGAGGYGSAGADGGAGGGDGCGVTGGSAGSAGAIIGTSSGTDFAVGSGGGGGGGGGVYQNFGTPTDGGTGGNGGASLKIVANYVNIHGRIFLLGNAGGNGGNAGGQGGVWGGGGGGGGGGSGGIFYLNASSIANISSSSLNISGGSGGSGGTGAAAGGTGGTGSGGRIKIWAAALYNTSTSVNLGTGGTYYYQQVDAVPPTSTLSVPASGASYSNFYNNTINFTCNATDNAQLGNVTLYTNISGSWQANQTTSISGLSASASWLLNGIPPGSYKWNCLVYDNAGNSAWAASNWTFTVSQNISYSETYSATSQETDTQQFYLNLNTSGASDVNATMVWNNTNVSPSKTSASGSFNFTASKVTPIITSGTSVGFYWNLSILLTNGSVINYNTSNHTQALSTAYSIASLASSTNPQNETANVTYTASISMLNYSLITSVNLTFNITNYAMAFSSANATHAQYTSTVTMPVIAGGGQIPFNSTFTVSDARTGTSKTISSATQQQNVTEIGLVLYFLDEVSLANLTDVNISLIGTSNTLSFYNLNNTFQVNLSNLTSLPIGNITIKAVYAGMTRLYYVTISGSQQTVYIYFPSSSASSSYITFHVYNGVTLAPLKDVLIQAQRSINSTWTTVEEKKTDNSGTATLFLDVLNAVTYQMIFTASGYATLYESINPSPTQTSYSVYMYGSTSINMSSPFADIWWYLNPPHTSLINSTHTFQYNVFSNLSLIQYYGMSISNGTTNLFFSNLTTNSSGGTISTAINLAGMIGNVTATVWFKESGYDQWSYTRIYGIWNYAPGNNSLWEIVQNVKGNPAAFPPIGLAFIALLISMLAAGLVSRFTMLGSGIVLLIMLGIFTFAFGWLDWKIYLLLSAVTVSIIYLRSGV